MAGSLHKPGFAFFEVVEILATMFGVHSDRRDTFVSRLQQLQKLGLPGGVNVGRGVKVRYVNWQLADLAMMLDLIDSGMSPGTLQEFFIPRARNYLGVYSTGGYGWGVQNSLADDQPDLFLLLRFNALAYLKRPRVEGEDTSSPFDRVDMGRTSKTITKELDKAPGVAINMTTQLQRLRAAVERAYPDRMEDIAFYPTRSGLKEE
jgi:hypothetical protein